MIWGLKEILDIGEKNGFAVPAFNVYNLETIMGVMQAAETCVRIDSVSIPNPNNVILYNKQFEKHTAIHDALAPIYQSRQ